MKKTKEGPSNQPHFFKAGQGYRPTEKTATTVIEGNNSYEMGVMKFDEDADGMMGCWVATEEFKINPKPSSANVQAADDKPRPCILF